MSFAGGILRWSEEQFWSASFPYFRAAIEGHAIANGTRKLHGKAPTRDQYEAAKAALAERDRKRAGREKRYA